MASGYGVSANSEELLILGVVAVAVLYGIKSLPSDLQKSGGVFGIATGINLNDMTQAPTGQVTTGSAGTPWWYSFIHNPILGVL